VLDLYARIFEGKPLGKRDFVVCADEKTSIQARCRCRPTLPPGRARMMRVEHEYERGGALAYLAAYDVQRGQGDGPLRRHHRHRPVRSACHPGHVRRSPTPRLGGCSGSWTTARPTADRPRFGRLQAEWPTLRLIHLPVHASWLDQVEIYFSIVGR
jgi:hypothetical protein